MNGKRRAYRVSFPDTVIASNSRQVPTIWVVCENSTALSGIMSIGTSVFFISAEFDVIDVVLILIASEKAKNGSNPLKMSRMYSPVVSIPSLTRRTTEKTNMYTAKNNSG